jgi:hypothetical protein
MKYSDLQHRLQRLEPEPEELEPWPPDEEGSLAKVLYDQLKDAGYELPAERPEGDIVLFLLRLEAADLWADYPQEALLEAPESEAY